MRFPKQEYKQISGKFVKDYAEILVKTVGKMQPFNFPKYVTFKEANLRQVFIIGEKNSYTSYKPTFMLQLICDILDKVVHYKTNSFLINVFSKKFLYNYHWGFQKSNSTVCVCYFHLIKHLKDSTKN